jgi:hypothetical protein
MSAGMPPIAPVPLSVRATAPIHAIRRAQGSRRSKPTVAIKPAIPESDDIAIEVTSTTSTRPTAEGSGRKPLTNQAHHVFTTAPASSAAQSHTGLTGPAAVGRA